MFISKVEACQKINELMLESLETDKIVLMLLMKVAAQQNLTKNKKKN